MNNPERARIDLERLSEELGNNILADIAEAIADDLIEKVILDTLLPSDEELNPPADYIKSTSLSENVRIGIKILDADDN